MVSWPLKAKANHLARRPCFALEGLGIALVVGPAGGVADVADGGGAVLPAHDLLELLLEVQAEPLGHRPEFLVRGQDRLAGRVVARHPRGELPPVLHVQKHPGDQPRDAVDVAGKGRQPGNRTAFGVAMVDGRHAALVVQFAHRTWLHPLSSTRPRGATRVRDGGDESLRLDEVARVRLGVSWPSIIMIGDPTDNLHGRCDPSTTSRRNTPRRGPTPRESPAGSVNRGTVASYPERPARRWPATWSATMWSFRHRPGSSRSAPAY